MAVVSLVRDTVRQAVEEPEPLSLAEFEALSTTYPDLRMELTREGEILIMPPAGTETGGYNAEVTADLVAWNRKTKTGKVFDSSAGFTFPNGARRSPDTAWIEKSRWEALTAEQRKAFAPICPDFVIELRSPTDRLSTIQKKMREYLDNGIQLGWLIDPVSKQVEIHRPNQKVEILANPTSVSGDPILPGFVLDLTEIWSP